MDMQALVHPWRRVARPAVLLALCAAAASTLSILPARAAGANAGDPPDRVARVSYVAGQAGLLPNGADQWRDVDINRPLVAGDRLSTGPDARLELEFDDAALRLAGDTAFGVLQLDDWQTRASLTRGTLQMSVGELQDGESYEIDTPQVAVVVDRPAHVRVDLGAGNATTVWVREGSAVVYGDDGARQVVSAGERYRFDDAALADVEALTPDEDAFSRWCRSRDRLHVDAESGRYVSAGTVGYQDLDRYGQWQDEDDYGQVWFPGDVGPDWVPYRDGHWAWIAPWGWTWVSDAAWGFAPFHYGRWHAFDGRWGWIPGPAGVRAVYAPALVAFVGGTGWQVSVGFGTAPVGWYPLGPGMVYNPWYGASRRYYWRVNRNAHRRHHRHWRQHVDAAYNVWRKPVKLRHARYLGKHPPHGITVVSHQVLAEGRDVRKARRLRVDAASLRHAPVRFHGMHVRPAVSRRDRLAASTVRRLPVHDFARPVVARHESSLAMTGHGRPTRTPWASPVRLLRHPRPVHADPAHSARHPIRAKMKAHERVSSKAVHHPAQPSHATPWRAVVAARHAESMHGRSRPEADRRPLPVVPRLRAAPVRRVEHHHAQRVAPVRRRPTSLPSPPRRLNTVSEHASGHHPARPVWRARPPRTPDEFRSPRMVHHRSPPPVRAVSRPHRFIVRHPPQSHPRPQPHVSRPAPVKHAVRMRVEHHPAPRGHGNPHRKPVRFQSH